MPHERVGTSGWNYPTGKGTWNGVFYPVSRERPRGFDELEFYARYFDTVEVNSTFYGQPRRDISRSWCERTPPGFEFSVKLYQKFTHPRLFQERVRHMAGATEPPEPLVAELARPIPADIDAFRRGIDPLAEQGKLGAILAQFPPSFKSGPDENDYLLTLLRTFAAYPVAVELRHRSWSDRIESTLELLNEFQAAWVQIDEPKFRFSIRQDYLPNICGFYYMRLHGRNAANWWRRGAAENRYDYMYSSNELRQFSDTAAAARQIVKKLYLYTNNHFAAKSVANAVTIKRQLGIPESEDYPAELLVRYPDLRTSITKAAVSNRRFVT